MLLELYDSDAETDADPILAIPDWRGPLPDIGDVLTIGKRVFDTHDREIVADAQGVVTKVCLRVDDNTEEDDEDEDE